MKPKPNPNPGRLLPALLCLTCWDWASAQVFDFESASDERWTTVNRTFYRAEAGSQNHVPGIPKLDTTNRSSPGHYGLALYDPRKEQVYLVSQCLEPTGPDCRIQFKAMFRVSAQVSVLTMQQCNCKRDVHPRTMFKARASPTHAGEGWLPFNITLGRHAVNFEITIATILLDRNEFLAIDDIELIGCDPVPVPPANCPSESPFYCAGSGECRSRDQLCDRYQDCMCGEDETEDLCGAIPPEGFLELQECDPDLDHCLWYNAGKGPVRWQRHEEVLSADWHHAPTHQSADPPDETFHAIFARLTIPKDMKEMTSVLRSVNYEPRFSGGGLCQIRFWHRLTGQNVELRLELAELVKKKTDRQTRMLWSSRQAGEKAGSGQWRRQVVDLNSVAINASYVLQFKAVTTSSYFGTVDLLNISLGPECFSSALRLTTCGEEGQNGPSQELCDQHYLTDGVVDVENFTINDNWARGVQAWTVPETAVYKIEAFGARGGYGGHLAPLLSQAKGSHVTAKFQLEKGERIHFVIGQIGDHACQDLSITPTAKCKLSHLQEIHHKYPVAGGGGGGATYIYKKQPGQTTPDMLLWAGGGGGMPFFYNRREHMEDEENGDTTDQSNSEKEYQEYLKIESNISKIMTKTYRDMLLKVLPAGLSACVQNEVDIVFSNGGFGLGFGACYGGGYGGGAAMKDAKKTNGTPTVGRPGQSYVSDSAIFSLVSHEVHEGFGMVEVSPVGSCDCSYYCQWLDDTFQAPTCYLPGQNFATHAAIESREFFPWYFVVALCVGIGVVVCLLAICIYLRCRTIRARHPTSLKKMASFFCPCVHLSGNPATRNVLPQIQRPPAIMHLNPNYDRVSTKEPHQDLKEINRKHLKLMSELGQGAFGEVYYGLLSNVPMVVGDLPVAVKTLPPVCTEQTEMDFLMEAVIVSKFNHPNIVKFIGVCFDQHPHYLVLELLEGGDLKSFLLQARPKWEQPSPLTVLDLLRLSLDIARGCQHLEEKHFIHRDIAARNCLLTTKGPNRMAKIADFGMARDIYRSDYYKKAGKAMLPVKWMPPEAFLDGVFSSKTDVWSFGILMWEVFSLGHMPYPGRSNEEVMNLVTQGGRLESPGGCPSAVFDIMASCWNAMPEGRPNFSLIIASLERRLKDDDVATRGLPVFYVSPIVNTRSPRLTERPSFNSPHPKTGASRGVIHPSENTLSPNTASDGYLEPLLTLSSREVIHDTVHKTPSDTGSRKGNTKFQQKGPEFSKSEHLIDNTRTSVKSRTPRVFYKPGTNHAHSPADPAHEALLHSQSTPENITQVEECVALSNGDREDSNTKLSDSGCDSESCDVSSEIKDFNATDDLKMADVVELPELNPKRKSYTHFPRASSQH